MDDSQYQQFAQDVVGVFDRAAPLYDQVGGHEFRYFGRQFVEWLNVPAGASVLDIATGRGAILFPAAERVGREGRVTGIDLAPNMIRQTADEIQQRGIANAELHVMDGNHPTFPDGTFDFVTCGFALHFLQYEQALVRFRHLLKPSGIFGAIQPTQADAEENQRWSWLFKLTKTCFPPGFQPPLAWRSPNQLNHRERLELVLRGAGFTDIEFLDSAVTLYWKDEDDWWQWEWSQGSRFWLEGMTPDMLKRFKYESFRHLEQMKAANGISHTFTALYVQAKI